MSLFNWFASSQDSDVEEFMEGLLHHAQRRDSAGADRDQERRAVVIGVQLIPCDETGAPDSTAAFDAATHDVTTAGFSFSYSREFRQGEALVLGIDYDGKQHFLNAEVRHSTGLGRNQFLTGCSILGRAEPPTSSSS